MYRYFQTVESENLQRDPSVISHSRSKMQQQLCEISEQQLQDQLKGSVKEPNKFHIYETEKITCKASDAAEYIELFGSFTRDRHARCI